MADKFLVGLDILHLSQPGIKIGHSVFVRLRDEAKAKQRARFDLKAYHDAVLGIGRVPLDLLEVQGRRWISGSSA